MPTRRPSSPKPLLLLLLTLGCTRNTPLPQLPRAPEGALRSVAVGDEVLVFWMMEDVGYRFTPSTGAWSEALPLSAGAPREVRVVGETVWMLTTNDVLRSEDRGQSWQKVASAKDATVARFLADGSLLALQHGAPDDAQDGAPGAVQVWLLPGEADTWKALPPLTAIRNVWGGAALGAGAVMLGGKASTAPDQFCDHALFFDGEGFNGELGLQTDHCPAMTLALPDGAALALGSLRRFEAYAPFATKLAPGLATAVPLPGDLTLGQFGAAVAQDGKVVVVGGARWSEDPDAPGAPSAQTWVLNPTTLAWENGPELAQGRLGPTAVALKDEVLVLGGVDVGGNAVLSVERFSGGP